MADGAIGFGRPAATRIRNTVKRVESQPYLVRRETPRAVFSGTGSAQLAITDGTISARSTTTPGSGNVFLVTYNGSVLVTGSTVQAVLSYSSTTGGIATGVYCWIEQSVDGSWWITSVDCSN